AARENIWCWFFGLLNAVLSIYLFFLAKLYAESVLYFYYVLASVYGWYAWQYERRNQKPLHIITWPWHYHLLTILAGTMLSLLLAWVLWEYTDAQLPIIDAHTTIFSFIATFLVTRKVLENWIYWIVIDAVSVGLYWSRDLYLYALLMFAYTFIAIWGYGQWKKLHQPSS
ncbi:MAG: nicotinamide riboside transporter PnuC, partial [Saprospiraceae bacterium]|nr:nicotinamide riboside transporter PnuC [Saprospiraceae bacterium]